MICVDSNEYVVEINSEYNELAEKAEKRTILFHFCKLSNLDDILATKSLLLNNIKNFKEIAEYEKQGIDSKFLSCVFISCLTHNENQNNLWRDFADDGRGVKLAFECDGIFHDVILDKSKKVKAYSKSNKLLAEYGFGVSSIIKNNIFHSPNYSTGITVDLSLIDVRYSNKIPTSTVGINNTRYLNLSTVSRTIIQKFNDEYETRIVGILKSIKKTCVDDISYLLVPLDFSKFKLCLEFGNKVTAENRSKYRKLLDSAQLESGN